MATLILEGSLSEVRRGLSKLSIKPDDRLSVLLDAPAVDSEDDIPPFHATEFWNGMPLLPMRKLDVPITQELVDRLSEDAADWAQWR